ncbi:10452_t:CDS:1, partial [Paraglomus occultum]
MTIKSNDPNYRPTNPVLPPYKPESVDETQELFDSIPITTDIVSDEICKESSCNNIAEKSETQNQSNISEQFSSITETKIEIPESLSSLSSEFLIKNKSDVNILIFYLHEKFNMSQEG